MNDPERWLDPHGDATGLEREVVSSLRRVDPPPGAEQAVWASLSARLGPPPRGGGASGGAGGASASASAVLKALAGGALAGVLASGGFLFLASSRAMPSRHVERSAATPSEVSALAAPRRVAAPSVVAPPTAPPPGAAARAAVAAASRAPLADVPAPAARDAVATFDPAPAVPADTTAPAAARASDLAEEARLLREAKRALRGGDAGRALALLDGASARFPSGALGEEREALTVEALMRAGRGDAARARAQAFVSAHPRSAHVQGVLQAIGAQR